jgi:hypothetical protein
LGKFKYPTVGKVVKACLVFSHGNSDAERSVSANKKIVTSECSSFIDETIIAVRLVKDAIRHHRGSANTVTVDKDMILRARASKARYRECLVKRKHDAEEAQR